MAFIKVDKQKYDEFVRLVTTTRRCSYKTKANFYEMNPKDEDYVTIEDENNNILGYIKILQDKKQEYYVDSEIANMKKHDYYLKYFIKINAAQMMRIRNHSGLPLKMIRKGNRFFSSREDKIFNKYQNKRQWTVVMYSYSKVPDPRYFHGRELETSEIYLNPMFKYLIEG